MLEDNGCMATGPGSRGLQRGAVGVTQAYVVKARRRASDTACAFRDGSSEQQHICNFLPSLSSVYTCLRHPLSFSGTSPDASVDHAAQSRPGEVNAGG